MNQLIFNLALVFFGTKAWAARPLVSIPVSDPDHRYYSRAIDMDLSYRTQGLIGPHTDYNFSGNHPELGSLAGKIVVFNNGPKVNSKNLVLTVNGHLYFVETHFNEIYSRYHGKPFRIRRNWIKDEMGIFLLMKGSRRDPRSRLRVPIEITIKIGTSDAQALPELIYSEDRI